MPFSVQQSNATSRLIQALDAIRDAYYRALEEKDAAALIGIPAGADFPAPGDLDHVTRARLQNAHGAVDAFRVWLTTPAVLFAGNQPKAPLDAIVEMIR